MTATYEMIRTIPAKGFDWNGFNAALRSKYLGTFGNKPLAFCVRDTFDRWDAAKGMRAIRVAAMEMANYYVDAVSKRTHTIQPSDESRMWDSFEEIGRAHV